MSEPSMTAFGPTAIEAGISTPMLAGISAVVFGNDLIAAKHPDALLLMACASYHAVKDEDDETVARTKGAVDYEWSVSIVERIDAAVALAAGLPATTREGLVAKASMIERHLPGMIEDYSLDRESNEIRLLLSLTADIARGVS
jgi:hypothetical protein